MTNTLTNGEVGRINDAVKTNPLKYLGNQWTIRFRETDIRATEAALQEDFGPTVASKAVSTPHFGSLGIRTLYNGLYQLFVEHSDSPVSFGCYDETEERCQIFYIKFGKKTVLVKAYQGNQERLIAKIADELGVGPKTYGPGVDIVEEYLPHMSLSGPPFEVGEKVGTLLRKLHDKGIIYADCFGRHFRADRDKNTPRLIDFGMSFIYDGTKEISNRNDLGKVVLLVEGPMGYNELYEIANDEGRVRTYKTIPPEELKRHELQRLVRDETAPHIVHFGYNLFGRKLAKFRDGIEEGYSTPNNPING